MRVSAWTGIFLATGLLVSFGLATKPITPAHSPAWFEGCGYVLDPVQVPDDGRSLPLSRVASACREAVAEHRSLAAVAAVLTVGATTAFRLRLRKLSRSRPVRAVPRRLVGLVTLAWIGGGVIIYIAH